MTASELTREQLAELPGQMVRAGRRARPEVKTVSIGNSEVLIKDYRSGKSLFGRLLGRFLVFREKTAYQRLRDLPGIPRYYGTLDPYALILQHVPAEGVLEVDRQQVLADFFRLLSEFKLDNILIDRSGRPVIVDFTSAIMTGSNPLVALLFPIFCDDDWRGIYKLKDKVAPELLTEQQRAFLQHRSLGERMFRRIREPVRSVIKRWSSR